MASPQVENGYTKISNELMDALCRIRIPGEVRQVFDVILRKTYGWNKKMDAIALGQFVDMTGIKKPNVVRAIKTLVDMKLIVISIDNAKITKYCVQKDYSKWVSLSKQIKPMKHMVNVISSDNKSLSDMIPTKDNTKERKKAPAKTPSFSSQTVLPTPEEIKCAKPRRTVQK